MDARQEIMKQCKRSMYIWVGILALFCLIIAVVFTLAELKWIEPDTDSEYIRKTLWRIARDWISAPAAPVILYLFLAICRRPFFRMIDNLTPSEQSRYLETYRRLPWFAKTFPGIVYSNRYIYVFSVPMAAKTKKICIADIDMISGNCYFNRGTVVSVYTISGESIHFTCSRWDLLSLYTLYMQGKIPEISGIPSNVEERYEIHEWKD